MAYRALIAVVLLGLSARLLFWPSSETPGKLALAESYFRCPCPTIFAHRGASAYRPENTLPAFRLALRMGADILELDVQLSRDNEVVVFHDADLERVTGVSRPLRELTLRELRALDAGATFTDERGRRPFAGKGIRIALLSEVLRAFPRKRVNIELKSREDDLPLRVQRVLSAARAHDRVLVNSARDSVMDTWMKLGRHRGEAAPPGAVGASTGRVVRAFLAYTLGQDYRASAHAFQLPAHRMFGLDLTGEAFIDFLHWRYIRVHYWTVNDPQQMRLLVDRGADGIMTDRPDVAYRLLAEMGLRPRGLIPRKY